MVPFFWKSLSEDGEVMAVCDQVACLTFAPDLAKAIIDIISHGGSGLYHTVCEPGLTPAQVAGRLAEGGRTGAGRADCDGALQTPMGTHP